MNTQEMNTRIDMRKAESFYGILDARDALVLAVEALGPLQRQLSQNQRDAVVHTLTCMLAQRGCKGLHLENDYMTDAFDTIMVG